MYQIQLLCNLNSIVYIFKSTHFNRFLNIEIYCYFYILTYHIVHQKIKILEKLCLKYYH